MRRLRANSASNQFEDLTIETWMASGACVTQGDPDDWFPTEKRSTPYSIRAINICGQCPVRTDCLDYVLNYPGLPLKGIWAGTSYEQRRKAVRERQKGLHRSASYTRAAS